MNDWHLDFGSQQLARRDPAPDPLPIYDESAAMEVGIASERDLACFGDEHLVADGRVTGPYAVEIGRLARVDEKQHRPGACDRGMNEATSPVTSSSPGFDEPRTMLDLDSKQPFRLEFA